MPRTMLLLTVAWLALGSSPSGASVWVIRPDRSGDFPTIQAAIDAAADGDVIELADGVFQGDGNWDLDYLGRAVTVRSQSGDPEVCYLDCRRPPEEHHGVYFHRGEGPGSVLRGIGIVGGRRAITCDNASPTLIACRFQGCWTIAPAGAVSCEYGSPTIRDCEFVENSAGAPSGALAFFRCTSPRVSGCTFTRNYSGWCGGALMFFESDGTVDSCVFIGNRTDGDAGAIQVAGCTVAMRHISSSSNSAGAVGGFMSLYEAVVTISNSTLVGDMSTGGGAVIHCDDASTLEMDGSILALGGGGPAVHCGAGSSARLSCCDVFGNEGGDWVECLAGQEGADGNRSENPLFCDMDAADLTLHANSPCAPDSNPDCGLIGAWSVGCADTPVEETTWGAIKAMFRR